MAFWGFLGGCRRFIWGCRRRSLLSRQVTPNGRLTVRWCASRVLCSHPRDRAVAPIRIQISAAIPVEVTHRFLGRPSFRSSIAQPTDASVYASPAASRRPVQDSRSGWSRFSFPVGLFHPLQHAGLSRRTLSPTADHRLSPLLGTRAVPVAGDTWRIVHC